MKKMITASANTPTSATATKDARQPQCWPTHAPAGTPRPIVDRLQQELAAIVKMPDVAARMADQGQTPVAGTPEELVAAWQAQAPRWIEYIKASGARAD